MEEDERIGAHEQHHAELLAAIVESSGDAILSVDANGCITSWNAHAVRLFGATAADVVGLPLTAVAPAVVADHVVRAGDAIARGSIFHDELTIPVCGSEVRVSVTVSPVCSAGGSVIGAAIIARDVSERHADDVLLQTSELQFRTLFEEAPVAQLLVEPSGRIAAANDAACRLLARDRPDLVGLNILDVTARDDRERTARMLHRLVVGDTDTGLYRKRYLRQDGVTVLVETTIAAIRNGSATYFAATLTDLSELDDVNDQLAQRETLHRAVVEVLTEGVVVQDHAGVIVSWNRAAELILGLTAEQMAGRTSYDPRWAVLRPDGTAMAGEEHPAMVTLRTGRPVDDALMGVARPDGSRVWIMVNARVLPSLERSARGVVTSFRDVTQQLDDRARIEQANTALADANRELATASQFKDDLLSIVSHELRTPLTPIIGFLDLLDRRGDNLRDEQRQMLAVMGRNARRMLRLVDDLLVVTRATAGTLQAGPEEVEVAAVITDVLADLGATIPPVDVDVAGWHAHVDPAHLHQVLANLLTNAAKYGAPPITVTARASGAGRVSIDVTDRGPGVPAALVTRMWERFSQGDGGNTRTSRGVGLGLAIVRLLAEVNGGSARYHPAEPTGATFTVELPGTRCADHHPAAVAGPVPRTDASVCAGPADIDEAGAGAVAAWARRQLRRTRSADLAVAILLRVVHQFGGWTVPARLADDRALPVDLSFGTGEPVLPVADPHSTARSHLERALPTLVEEARRVVHRANAPRATG